MKTSIAAVGLGLFASGVSAFYAADPHGAVRVLQLDTYREIVPTSKLRRRDFPGGTLVQDQVRNGRIAASAHTDSLMTCSFLPSITPPSRLEVRSSLSRWKSTQAAQTSGSPHRPHLNAQPRTVAPAVPSITQPPTHMYISTAS